jgi:hypothetical protein
MNRPPGHDHHRDHGDRPGSEPPPGEHDTDYLSDTIEGRGADLFATRTGLI